LFLGSMWVALERAVLSAEMKMQTWR